MAATRLLLLFLATWQVNAQGTCNTFTSSRINSTTSGLTRYDSPTIEVCQAGCLHITNCFAFVWDRNFNRCQHRYGYIIDGRPSPNSILFYRACAPFTPPPFIPTPWPTFTRPSTRTTPRPTQQTVFPPFFTTTTTSPCPPVKGLTTGLVVLIAVFTAIGGIILGMLLAVKCCPMWKKGGWAGSSHVSGCACKTRTPSCTHCQVQGCSACNPPHHPHVLHDKLGHGTQHLPSYPSNVHAGQTYAVPANPFNGTYSVSIVK